MVKNTLSKIAETSKNARLPSLGSSKPYDIDEDLFSSFAHDLKQCTRGLKFLVEQTDRIAHKYWPRQLQSNIEVMQLLLRLLGEHSLQFEELPKFHIQFDLLQAHSEMMFVHPKEREFTVPSIQEQLANYCTLVAHLQQDILVRAQAFYTILKQKVQTILVHLKHMQASLKVRDTLSSRCDKTEKKLAKLEKKSSGSTAELSASLAVDSAKLSALNTKLKTILPESLLLIEEFVDSLVKWSICSSNEMSEKISEAYVYLTQFHGLLDAHMNSAPQDFESVVSQWEADATPSRLRIESLLSAIRERNPDLLDEEITGTDNSSNVAKAWSHLTKKIKEKHHKVKPKDRENGVFHSHQMADPLRSYVANVDSSSNLRETYHPSKIIEPANVIVVSTSRPVPPPLPPRNTSSPIHLKSPTVASSPSGLFSPASQYGFPSSPAQSPATSVYGDDTNDAIGSTHSHSELSLALEDSDTESSVSEVAIPESVVSTGAQDRLIKLYNSHKNDITTAPVLPSKYDFIYDCKAENNIFDPMNSATLRLLKLNHYFESVASAEPSKSNRVVIACKDFDGQQPGDLSFVEGDRIEVLSDLQSNIITYNPSGENWFVGATIADKDGKRRIGFAPNTHFSDEL